MAFGLSDSGADPPDGCFAGGRRAADAGAELVGWAEGPDGGAAAWLGGGGSAFMMLTGGIDAADGKVTLGPAGTPDGALPPLPLEASGRVRDGQLTA